MLCISFPSSSGSSSGQRGSASIGPSVHLHALAVLHMQMCFVSMHINCLRKYLNRLKVNSRASHAAWNGGWPPDRSSRADREQGKNEQRRISDAISMRTRGMCYRLQSSNRIADINETVMGAERYDANISIPGCDKNMTGTIMAMGWLTRPSIMVNGGTIKPGNFQGNSYDMLADI